MLNPNNSTHNLSSQKYRNLLILHEGGINLFPRDSCLDNGGHYILPSMKSVTGELVKGNNILISIVIDDIQILENYFSNLSVGGYVIMPY
jgi:hypothetical protein